MYIEKNIVKFIDQRSINEYLLPIAYDPEKNIYVTQDDCVAICFSTSSKNIPEILELFSEMEVNTAIQFCDYFSEGVVDSIITIKSEYNINKVTDYENLIKKYSFSQFDKFQNRKTPQDVLDFYSNIFSCENEKYQSELGVEINYFIEPKMTVGPNSQLSIDSVPVIFFTAMTNPAYIMDCARYLTTDSPIYQSFTATKLPSSGKFHCWNFVMVYGDDPQTNFPDYSITFTKEPVLGLGLLLNSLPFGPMLAVRDEIDKVGRGKKIGKEKLLNYGNQFK